MTRPIDLEPYRRGLNRRAFLGQSSYGLGGLALAGLMGREGLGADRPDTSGRIKGVVDPLHVPAKARRVIHLCMAGGPSQFESLDPKAELKRLDGRAFPESFTRGQQLAQLQGAVLKARGSFVDFHRHGRSGQEISDLFPHVAGIADEIAIVRSMQTEQINHDPAHAFMNSGSILKGRPSMARGCSTASA